jgi:hypothetical protein
LIDLWGGWGQGCNKTLWGTMVLQRWSPYTFRKIKIECVCVSNILLGSNHSWSSGSDAVPQLVIATVVPVSDKMQSDVFYLPVLWENITLSCGWFFPQYLVTCQVLRLWAVAWFMCKSGTGSVIYLNRESKVQHSTKLHENKNCYFYAHVFYFVWDARRCFSKYGAFCG